MTLFPNSRDGALAGEISTAIDPDSTAIRIAVAHSVAHLRPTMVLASAYAFPEAAESGYLMQQWLRSGGFGSARWHSLFVNSGTEALSTFIKYSRNRVNRTQRLRACAILTLDVTGTSTFSLGHDVPGLRSCHSDGIVVCRTVVEFLERIAIDHWDSVMIFIDRLDQHELDQILVSIPPKAPNSILAWGVLTDVAAMERLPSLTEDADAVIVGEAITRGQLPGGVVAMTHSTFDLWNNPVDSVAHVSTFGGNGLAVSLIRDELHARVTPNRPQRRAIERMRRSKVVRRARLRLHGNTWQTRAMDIAGINIDFDSAHGIRYRAGDRTYVDLASGAGPAYRGHNRLPLTIITPELRPDEGTDRLESRLQSLTGLDVLLPAVSGATAVDAAILAALYARPGRHTIVTVRGNYSGKSAVSLSVSRTSTHFRDLDVDAFRPSLPQVEELSIDDVDRLDEILDRDDIALVWLEPIQGLDCIEVPKLIVDSIRRHKRPGGYLVGVDEVLTGIWRADSANFLASAPWGPFIDICALSKGLSNAIVPIGAAMVSSEVFAAVRTSSPAAADWLRTHFHNDFAAELADYGLGEASKEMSGRESVETSLDAALGRASRSRIFSGYHRFGLHSRLVLSASLWGVARRPETVDLYEAIVARLLARRCGAVTLQLRVLPCIATPEHEALVASLDSVGKYLEGLSRTKLYTETISSSVLGGVTELLIFMTALVENRRGND